MARQKKKKKVVCFFWKLNLINRIIVNPNTQLYLINLKFAEYSLKLKTDVFGGAHEKSKLYSGNP